MSRVSSFVVTFLCCLGCSRAPSPTLEPSATPANPSPAVAVPVAYQRPISRRVDDATKGIAQTWWDARIYAWDLPAVDWSTISPDERRQLSGLTDDPFVRFTGNGFRIVEYHRGSQGLKMRAREEPRGTKWVRHGPTVVYETDGNYEISFAKEGENHGPRIRYDEDGKELNRSKFVHGILQKAD